MENLKISHKKTLAKTMYTGLCIHTKIYTMYILKYTSILLT